MARPLKYPAELREWALRMVAESLPNYDTEAQGAVIAAATGGVLDEITVEATAEG